jgi:hypothetical protein
MGSGLSRPCATDDAPSTMDRLQPSTTTAAYVEENVANASQTSPPITTTKGKKKPPENESGYERAQRLCRKHKRKYDGCYTAQLSSKEEDCNDLFEEYRSCFLRVMAKDMEKRGVQVNESSMIGEYKEEIADENI